MMMLKEIEWSIKRKEEEEEQLNPKNIMRWKTI